MLYLSNRLDDDISSPDSGGSCSFGLSPDDDQNKKEVVTGRLSRTLSF
jgi:hypothetical protein